MNKTFEGYFDAIKSKKSYLFKIFTDIKSGRDMLGGWEVETLQLIEDLRDDPEFVKLNYKSYLDLRVLHPNLKLSILPLFFEEWSSLNKNILSGLWNEELKRFFIENSLIKKNAEGNYRTTPELYIFYFGFLIRTYIFEFKYISSDDKKIEKIEEAIQLFYDKAFPSNSKPTISKKPTTVSKPLTPKKNEKYKGFTPKEPLSKSDIDTTIKLDSISIKYLFLNLFTLDPIHDFQEGATRIKDHTDIVKDLNELIRLLRLKTSSGSKSGTKRRNDSYDDGFMNKRGGGVTDLVKMTSYELTMYSIRMVDNFVENFTNFVFSDSLLNVLDIMQTVNRKKELGVYNLQELIIQPAMNKLENSEYSYIEVVKDKYIPKIKPLLEKAILQDDLTTEIKKAELEIKQDLYQLVLTKNNPVLFDVNKIIQDINTLSPNNQIVITEAEKNNPNALKTKIESLKRKILRQFHPDKTKSDTADQFNDINTNLLEIIRCIQDPNCLSTIKGGQNGGVNPKDQKEFLREMLAHNILYFLRYINVIEEENDDGDISVKFEPVTESMSIEKKNKYYLYNTQLFLIVINYKNIIFKTTKTELKDELLSELLDLDSLFGPFVEKNNIIIDPGNIEESIYNMITKIVKQNDEEDDMDVEDDEDDSNILLHGTNNKNIQASEIINKLMKNRDINQNRFVVNNAAKATDKIYGAWLKEQTFCPIPSILDGMALCKFKQDETETVIGDYLHDSKLQVKGGDLYYIVDLQLQENEVDVLLTMQFGKEGKKDVGFQEYMDLTSGKEDTRLNAANSLRELIDYMLKKYNVLQNKINTRSKYTDVYRDFFEELGDGLIRRLLIKSIGDWSQEMYTVSKKSGITGHSVEKISPSRTNSQNNQLLIGITEDRLSACRMIFLQKFGKNTNGLSIAGAYSTNYKFLYGKVDILSLLLQRAYGGKKTRKKRSYNKKSRSKRKK
tara:strand:+ start:30986 stop:33847 length:2862 start_codon:yes stop_codon:yes gene_type:complete